VWWDCSCFHICYHCEVIIKITWYVLALSKIAINTIYIWMTDPDTPILAKNSPTFQLLLPTFKQLLLQTHDKVVHARQPIPLGKESTTMLIKNLRAYIHPDNSSFKEKAIQWY
jgi:hypothetical protein